MDLQTAPRAEHAWRHNCRNSSNCLLCADFPVPVKYYFENMAEMYDLTYKCQEYIEQGRKIPKALHRLDNLDPLRVDWYLLEATKIADTVRKLLGHPEHGRIAAILLERWSKIKKPEPAPTATSTESRKRQLTLLPAATPLPVKMAKISGSGRQSLATVRSKKIVIPQEKKEHLPKLMDVVVPSFPRHSCSSISSCSASSLSSPSSSECSIPSPPLPVVPQKPSKNRPKRPVLPNGVVPALLRMCHWTLNEYRGAEELDSPVPYSFLKPFLLTQKSDDLVYLDYTLTYMADDLDDLWHTMMLRDFGDEQKMPGEDWKFAYRRVEEYRSFTAYEAMLDRMIAEIEEKKKKKPQGSAKDLASAKNGSTSRQQATQTRMPSNSSQTTPCNKDQGSSCRLNTIKKNDVEKRQSSSSSSISPSSSAPAGTDSRRSSSSTSSTSTTSPTGSVSSKSSTSSGNGQKSKQKQKKPALFAQSYRQAMKMSCRR